MPTQRRFGFVIDCRILVELPTGKEAEERLLQVPVLGTRFCSRSSQVLSPQWNR